MLRHPRSTAAGDALSHRLVCDIDRLREVIGGVVIVRFGIRRGFPWYLITVAVPSLSRAAREQGIARRRTERLDKLHNRSHPALSKRSRKPTLGQADLPITL
jgi:hypothetical protein